MDATEHPDTDTEQQMVIDTELFPIILHLLIAWAVGSVIGLERSFHGRPAGFRTHALVCVTSALLMMVTTYQWQWLGSAPLETVQTDPTRMAQGIMTGIGFLGAGVIFKEGLSVRGLTTAASIWITAGLGILIGVGFYFPAFVGTAIAIGTLSIFRLVENRLPTHVYAHHRLTFNPDNVMPESTIREMLREHGFGVAQVSYRLNEGGAGFDYRLVIKTTNPENMGRLATSLTRMPAVTGFRIDPVGE